MSFWAKIRILGNSYCHLECDSFPVLKDISDEIGSDINKCDFLILNNEMIQDLEDQWSNISILPMHGNKSGVCKSPYKMQNRPINFNLYENFIDRASDSKMKLAFKKLLLVEINSWY